VIVVSSKPESKAFCAGGDVKNIVITAKSQTKESLAKAAKFFEEEYKLNHLIATSKKPFVSILNGITSTALIDV
jgi:3-hydroxyisobutyryl-CoA hydrolase